jgi:hypothetical protein
LGCSGEIDLVFKFSFLIIGSVFMLASFLGEEIVRLESVIWTTLRVGVIKIVQFAKPIVGLRRV